MAHIFISYSHRDTIHLTKLIEWLKQSDFSETEVWYDQQIEGGDNWRDEISVALDEAFAVLVILTQNSADSKYCTFEWAYAMGQGISVLPLIFDEISIASVPTPLTSKQFIDCTGEIPPSLKETLRRSKTVPPQTAILNKLVYDAIYETHRRFFILGWLGKGFSYLEAETREMVIAAFAKDAGNARETLQKLMLDKASAFSGRQYRFCWKLVDVLTQLSRFPYRYNDHLGEKLFARFDEEWLPAFEYFEGRVWWSRWVRRYFYYDLEDTRNWNKVFAEIIRAFPLLESDNVEILINNKKIELKRSNSNQQAE
jgi:hypothetical protein